MDIQTAKQIRIADYLHSLGYSPIKQQGVNLWYKSPLREEAEASFKVNTEREQWYDFGLGKGGGIIELAAHLYATDHGKYPLIPTLWMIFEDSTFAFRSGDKHRSRRIYGK